MSARPDFLRLSDEDLDLFLSRLLDGDLSPSEEREVSEILATDPRAARRRDELAGLVGRLNALPAPASPLGLTARVNAHAAERSKGMGAFWHRLGLFPPPAMVRGIVALFAIVLIGINVLRSQSERQKAEEQVTRPDDGRVSVYLGDEKTTAPAEAKAKTPATKGKAAGRLAQAAPRAAPEMVFLPEQAASSNERDREADAVASSKPVGELEPKSNTLEARRDSATNVPGSRDEATAKKAKAEAGVAEAPAPAAAPLARPFSWSIRIVGSPGWLLTKAPHTAPSSRVSARCFVTLDAAGRVVDVRPTDGSPLPPEIGTLVRGLLFERGPSPPVGGAAPVLEIEVTTR